MPYDNKITDEDDKEWFKDLNVPLPPDTKEALELIIKLSKPILRKLRDEQGKSRIIFSNLKRKPLYSFTIDKRSRFRFIDETLIKEGPLDEIVDYTNPDLLEQFIDMFRNNQIIVTNR